MGSGSRWQEALRQTVEWERASPFPDRAPSERELRSRYAAEDALLASIRPSTAEAAH